MIMLLLLFQLWYFSTEIGYFCKDRWGKRKREVGEYGTVSKVGGGWERERYVKRPKLILNVKEKTKMMEKILIFQPLLLSAVYTFSKDI